MTEKSRHYYFNGGSVELVPPVEFIGKNKEVVSLPPKLRVHQPSGEIELDRVTLENLAAILSKPLVAEFIREMPRDEEHQE